MHKISRELPFISNKSEGILAVPRGDVDGIEALTQDHLPLNTFKYKEPCHRRHRNQLV